MTQSVPVLQLSPKGQTETCRLARHAIKGSGARSLGLSALFLYDLSMIAELAAKRTEIQDICARYPVQRLAVFGSAATGSFNSESSDIDFLLQLQPVTPIQYKRAYFGLLSDLERLLGRSVDLVTESSIQNPYFNLEVQRSKEDIYVR